MFQHAGIPPQCYGPVSFATHVFTLRPHYIPINVARFVAFYVVFDLTDTKSTWPHVLVLLLRMFPTHYITLLLETTLTRMSQPTHNQPHASFQPDFGLCIRALLEYRELQNSKRKKTPLLGACIASEAVQGSESRRSSRR